MNIEVKLVKLTKSRIQQMEYISIPKFDTEVLGWVIINDKKIVIIRNAGNYYRAAYITKINKVVEGVQVSDGNGGYKFPNLTKVSVENYDGGIVSFSPNLNDEINIEFYNRLVEYKRKTEIAGQIYY